ncbi:hypothetical protein KIN20_019298 [Parelaphostrongylus tenuis]|uniref:Uncharacterized protein n=1 Tax=Parelaphostrongylus tenuis TaxID=148309 RepID=A0AAD5MPC1_PARTN|nr:hypothetical protein KIN20_019298 [Parelaphostrongylus tenuis]
MNEGTAANNQREVHHISADVSSRISTAQVIVSVSCAVRQLIDNSLDGCAQVIGESVTISKVLFVYSFCLRLKFAILTEIRAKNNGYDSIEVIDDGHWYPSRQFRLSL